MPCCLFYCHLASQLDPEPFKRVIAFCFSSTKKERKRSVIRSVIRTVIRSDHGFVDAGIKQEQASFVI